MYALFKDGENITGSTLFPLIWNYALASGVAHYRYVGDNKRAEVILHKGYTIEEVGE